MASQASLFQALLPVLLVAGVYPNACYIMFSSQKINIYTCEHEILERELY